MNVSATLKPTRGQGIQAMPNVATVLKEEITRLARKEAKAEAASSKKAISQHRRDIAELKRQVRSLTKDIGSLERQQKRSEKAAPRTDKATIRFSPSRLKSHRDRLEISAADYAALVGVSPLTIYNWEKGETKPRQKQVAAWAKIKDLGKREAWKRLEMMEG